MIVPLLLLLLAQIPEAVQNEPVAEKRYQLALDAAAKSLLDGKLQAAADATEFALKSLEDMGRPPYRNGRNYKRMELKTREFLRRAEALVKEAGIEDRPALEAARNRINAVHDTVLLGVMSKKP